jgi:tetratricopeptide (TPR) repeat protein
VLEALKKEANKTYTENMAVTHLSTLSDCLDLFATVGALRGAPEEEILSRFTRAFVEDPNMAIKLAFFARDARGGLGERRVFRLFLRWLAGNKPESVNKNIPNIPEYGRFDDLLALLGTNCEKNALAYIQERFKADLASLENGESVSLLAKWLPSVNASNVDAVKKAKRVARALGMNDADYRKALSRLRASIKIIENNLRESDYTFDYEKQPSKALFKYRKAFIRNDGKRYGEFMAQALSGEARLKTGSLTPYDIIAPFFAGEVSDEERRGIDVTWKAQEDFTNGENALVVVDGSGSMYSDSRPMPATVALSLGIYFAERNAGVFSGHFITFSENPRLVKIKGQDIWEKVRYCRGFNEVANTNVQRVFELILKTALKNGVPQEELPSTLYFISDMEFDCCATNVGMTNFEYAKDLFERNGYTLPRVVFWNVASRRNRQQPVTRNEQGVVLVSGCAPRVFSMLTSDALSPYAFMLEVLNSERYAHIAA